MTQTEYDEMARRIAEFLPEFRKREQLRNHALNHAEVTRTMFEQNKCADGEYDG